jgi:hypothetical protein
MPSGHIWDELLEQMPAYVVLRKGNRLQIIANPTTRQLRRRGRGDWEVAAAGGGTGDNGPATSLPDDLRSAVLDALAAMFSAEEAKAGGKKGKRKKREAASV